MSEPENDKALGRIVLVVEDEFLIAMELESVLTSSGFEVLGPASSVGQALNLLRSHVRMPLFWTSLSAARRLLRSLSF